MGGGVLQGKNLIIIIKPSVFNWYEESEMQNLQLSCDWTGTSMMLYKCGFKHAPLEIASWDDLWLKDTFTFCFQGKAILSPLQVVLCGINR